MGPRVHGRSLLTRRHGPRDEGLRATATRDIRECGRLQPGADSALVFTGLDGSYRLTSLTTGQYTVMVDPDGGGADQYAGHQLTVQATGGTTDSGVSAVSPAAAASRPSGSRMVRSLSSSVRTDRVIRTPPVRWVLR